MKTFASITRIAAPALLAALGVAASSPVFAHDAYSAQRHDARHVTPGRAGSVRSDIYALDRRIDLAAQHRTISSREARGLRNQSAQIKQLYARYARNGLTAYETRALKARIDRLEVALRAERRDHDRRRG
ncbi:hypothetical protein B2G71_01880 [Novosphingobium sp. PC22D]|uniref:hypothetical protein n=1 Tax=Novosphingobium sp. PC22D TaxID=1962403 RepID=UPI000BF0FF32|nr:hypothetical protein [Novosphingobium sp. PC22D]PEQ14373.1 hypothetical protein B2G71_01880 [Novosphingobium sp. PC22D]